MTQVFTAEQVLSLNAYQEAGHTHPFTCPREHRVMRGEVFEEPVCLRATTGGLVCWWPRCDFEQLWAFEYQKDWSWMDAGLTPSKEV